MIRLTHFVAIDMKTRLFITDIRKISFDRVGELSPERAERVQRCRRDDDKLRCIAGGLFMNKFLGGAKITVNEFGKPECDNGLCFNISHSGSYVLFALSGSEVGCDIEVVRPRDNWQTLANTVFSLREHAEVEAERPEQQLAAFWRIWTRKEAIVKQRGGSAWQIVSVDSTALTSSLSVSQCQLDTLSLAVCTPTPFTLTADAVQRALVLFLT